MTREQMNNALTCVHQFDTREDATALVWMGYDQLLPILHHDFPAMMSSGAVSKLNPFSLK